MTVTKARLERFYIRGKNITVADEKSFKVAAL